MMLSLLKKWLVGPELKELEDLRKLNVSLLEQLGTTKMETVILLGAIALQTDGVHTVHKDFIDVMTSSNLYPVVDDDKDNNLVKITIHEMNLEGDNAEE